MKRQIKWIHNYNITLSLDCVKIKGVFIHIYTNTYTHTHTHTHIYIYNLVTNYIISCKAQSSYFYSVYAECWVMLIDLIYNCSVSPYDDIYIYTVYIYIYCIFSVNFYNEVSNHAEIVYVFGLRFER